MDEVDAGVGEGKGEYENGDGDGGEGGHDGANACESHCVMMSQADRRPPRVWYLI